MLVAVPKVTNLFQEVVSIIYEHLADGASIEYSAKLPNRVTGYMREVDVILRSKTRPNETVIAIEATSRGDAASVNWVEQMIGKHKNLRTHKRVLVSERGFSKQARALAIAENMSPITAEVLTDADPAFRIVNSVRSLWPKQVNLTGPESARVWVDRPGEGLKWFQARPDLDVFTEDGSSIPLRPLIHALIQQNWHRIIEQFDLANIAENVDETGPIQVGPGWTIKIDGEEQSLYAQYAEGPTPELHRIDGMEITAKAEIRVSEVPLHHRRLAEINVQYAFGEGAIGDTPALFVATEDEEGGKLSVRLNPPYKQSKS
jgi:hypothetical protein